MKKILLALTAVTALTGSALAADLPARTYSKAPAVVAPVPTWTGFWISGGIGYGMSEYQHSYSDLSGQPLQYAGQDSAGKGWLGKVGLGYDYQFMGNFVVGAFADADWTNISGQYAITGSLTGKVQNDWNWAVGGRVGYVALPGLLTYFNGGYTQGDFKGTNYTGLGGVPSAYSLASQTRGGWFLGGGTEYAVSQVPGLFWKSEVRFSQFGDKTNSLLAQGAPFWNQTSHFFEQKATSELVYRFNWGGPVVAKY